MYVRSTGLIFLMAAIAPAGATSTQSGDAGKYMVCWSNHYNSRPFTDANFAFRLINSTQRTALSEWDASGQWREFVQKEVPSLVLGSANCNEYSNADAAARWKSKLQEDSSRPVEFSFVEPSNDAPAKEQGISTKTSPASAAEVETSPADNEVERQAERQRREAEWQAELDKYASDKAAWEAKVAAQKAEQERQKAAHAAAQEEARKVQAAHDAKMEAHRRRLADAQRAREEWLAVKRRHDRCMGGDRRACEDMDAGKPIDEEQLASSEEPKTSDDDARTCVSRPVVSASGTFKGQTAAVVFNGCKTAVDVRVCLLRTRGWNCGVTWGLQPQDRWTHTSFETQGEVFWDARVSGSNEPLASPEGD